ncbi:MAG TPA: AsmA family protein [Bauldia sp.]|nr:AsmA family protein [Bauldia sp.]
MAAASPRGTRRLAAIVLAVVAVIGAVAVSLPFLISSDAVRKRIADQVTYFTGRTFTFSGETRLRLFPYLTVRLENVRLANPIGMEGAPFISADAMMGKLEILPLLAGRLEFAEFRLVNPEINLAVDAAGNPNWILDQGVVGALAAKGDSERPGDDPSPPSPRADVSLGRFLVRNGTVNYSDARNGANEVLTDVSVDFNWRSTVEAARGRGTFLWRGEPVAFSGEIKTPLTLLAGGESPLAIAAEAAPATLSFEGMARQFDGMQIEGTASVLVPSVARFGAWTGAALGEAPPVGAVSVAGRVSWTAATLSISEARIDLDGNAGEGALSASIVDGKPNLQGTLDFARLDFNPFVAALSASLGPGGTWDRDAIRLPLLDALDLDLRVSAGQGVASGIEVGPLAASFLVRQGVLSVEVGEAHLGEGMVEASLAVSMDGDVLSATASLAFDGVPAETVTSLFGFAGVTGTGDANGDFSAEGATWGDLVASLSGSASIALADGTLPGIDLARLPEMIVDPAVPAGGSTAFTNASSTLAIVDGVAATDDLRIEGPGYALNLAGRAFLADDTVEARGVLTVLGEAPREVPFLISGPWSAPHLQPDLGAPLPRDAGGRADTRAPSNG